MPLSLNHSRATLNDTASWTVSLNWIWQLVLAATLVTAIPESVRALSPDRSSLPMQASTNDTPFYDAETLQYWSTYYEGVARWNWENVIRPVLTHEEREKFDNASLAFPIKQIISLSGPPVMSYSVSKKTGGHFEIAMPIATLRFIDEIATAYAWYVLKGADIGGIHAYLVDVKNWPAFYKRYRNDRHFDPSDSIPTLGEVLSVPMNALDDPSVSRLSRELFETTTIWLMSYHLSQRVLSHEAITQITATAHRNQVLEADRFAFDIMRRSGRVPYGVALYLQILSTLGRSPKDFTNHDNWKLWMEHSGFPSISERLKPLAGLLEAHVSDFTKDADKPDQAREAIINLAHLVGEMAERIEIFSLKHAITRSNLSKPRTKLDIDDLEAGINEKVKSATTLMQEMQILVHKERQYFQLLQRYLEFRQTDPKAILPPQISRMVFYTPDGLKWSDEREIVLLLGAPRKVQHALSTLAGGVVSRDEYIRMSEKMEALLTSPSLAVTPVSPLRQLANPNDVTTWTWVVSNKDPGTRRLYLSLNEVTSEKNVEFPRVIRQLRKSYDVEQRFVEKILPFVRQQWQWLWAAILIPVISLLWKWRRLIRAKIFTLFSPPNAS